MLMLAPAPNRTSGGRRPQKEQACTFIFCSPGIISIVALSPKLRVQIQSRLLFVLQGTPRRLLMSRHDKHAFPTMGERPGGSPVQEHPRMLQKDPRVL
jgi:hypothetical protein